MAEDIRQELQSLKEAAASLQRRISQLEARISRPESATSPSPRPAVSFPQPVRPPTPKARPARTGEGFEARVGRYWLNRLGVASLVLGLATFILYSFQYLGPAAKLGVGFAVGLALIGAGVWMERRRLFLWYARGLIGGGWAALYFTGYAMHHIPAVRVVESAGVGLAVLAVIAAGAILHSLKYRSQTITATAFLLGFLTVTISQITYFTLGALVLLAAGLVFLVVRMQWHQLALSGAVATYLVHGVWISRQIEWSPMVAIHVDTVGEARMWLSVGFLLLYWISYAVASLALQERKDVSRKRLLTMSVINTLVFAQMAILEVGRVFPDQRYLVCAGVGFLSVGVAALARRWGRPGLSVVSFLVGLGLLTVAIPLKVTDRWTTFFWLTESVVLGWVGLRYGWFRYRVFALVVAAVTGAKILFLDFLVAHIVSIFGGEVSWRLLIGLYGIVALTALGVCYRLPSFRDTCRPVERFWHRWYVGAAALLGLMLAGLEIGIREWLLSAWAMEALALTVLGFLLKDRGIRIMGVVCFGLAGLLLPTNFWQAERIVPTAVFLYAAAWLYRRFLPVSPSDWERQGADVYILAASVLLTRVLVLMVAGRWLSVGVAFEGLILLGAGFLLRERALRWSALAVFAFLALRILLVDLAGVATLYRILSFIVAGAILLLASLGYAKFTARPTQSSPEP